MLQHKIQRSFVRSCVVMFFSDQPIQTHTHTSLSETLKTNFILWHFLFLSLTRHFEGSREIFPFQMYFLRLTTTGLLKSRCKKGGGEKGLVDTGVFVHILTPSEVLFFFLLSWRGKISGGGEKSRFFFDVMMIIPFFFFFWVEKKEEEEKKRGRIKATTCCWPTVEHLGARTWPAPVAIDHSLFPTTGRITNREGKKKKKKLPFCTHTYRFVKRFIFFLFFTIWRSL